MKKLVSNDSLANNYVEKENRELREQLTEMRELLEYNKRALKVSVSSSAIQQQKLVSHLYEENEYLKGLLDKRNAEFETTFSNVLINEQIARASESHEKDLIEQLNGKVIGLRKQLKEKERQIIELQKTHPTIDSENSLQVKLVEITTASQLSTRLHDDMLILREQLEEKDKDLQKERKAREDILKLNIVLNRQLDEIKAGTTLLSTGATMRKSPLRGTAKEVRHFGDIIDIHNVIFNPGDSIDYPIGFDQHVQDDSLPTPLAHLTTKKSKKVMSVPKLELLKAKQIQQLIVKNMFDEEKVSANNKNAPSAKELTKLKEQISTLKKNLNREMLRNVELERRLDCQSRHVRELEERNNLLCGSKSLISNQIQRVEQSSTKHEQTFIGQMLNLGRAVYMNDNIDRVINSPKAPQATPQTFIARERSQSIK